MNKKAQEEIVGFAMIMILVAIVLLVFLGLSLNRPQEESLQSYEAESFLQSALQYTTNCEGNFGPQSVEDLIFECRDNGKCLDERDSCEVLESSLKGILESSWNVGNESYVKGYELAIVADEEALMSIEKGETTGNSKGASQSFSKSGSDFEIFFSVYS